MPTADTFQTRGRRNGFPFCLEDNVSELDNAFSTNTNGAISSVRFDRTNAILLEDLMFFFWNLHKFTTLSFVSNFTDSSGSGTTTDSGEGSIISAQVPPGIDTFDNQFAFGTIQPRKRVCRVEEDIYIANMGSTGFAAEFTNGFYFTPSRTSGGDPCIAYALNRPGGAMNPATANSYGTANGSEVSVNLPLNSSGATTAIKIVGITSGGLSTTAVSGNIVADFYTYS
tara:strand:- start:827 stop:1507 length:681 start_codon:yes stop_codon:yes gene_type:complete